MKSWFSKKKIVLDDHVRGVKHQESWENKRIKELMLASCSFRRQRKICQILKSVIYKTSDRLDWGTVSQTLSKFKLREPPPICVKHKNKSPEHEKNWRYQQNSKREGTTLTNSFLSSVIKYTWSYENRVSKHFVIFLNFPCLIACLLCCLLMSFFFACLVVRNLNYYPQFFV